MAVCDMDCFHCLHPDCICDRNETKKEKEMKNVAVSGKKSAYMKEYYKKNRERLLEYQKKYAKEHVEEIREYQIEYYLENADEKKEYFRKRYHEEFKHDEGYMKRHRERVREYYRRKRDEQIS